MYKRKRVEENLLKNRRCVIVYKSYITTLDRNFIFTIVFSPKKIDFVTKWSIKTTRFVLVEDFFGQCPRNNKSVEP